MKKLLIIGASVLQLPAIKKAKELGFYVGVVDFDPNAVGIAFADEYFNVSTIDAEAVAQTAKSFAPDGIMTLATDMPMRSIARAGEVTGLKTISFDTAIKSTDKGAMIRAFSECGVEHPWFYIIDDAQQLSALAPELSYPCIMKPTDNSGSRGVVLCKDTAELLKEYEYAKSSSRSGAVIVEEYLSGREVSVEVIVLNSKPHVIQVTDKITTGAPHFVEMGHSQPSSIDKENLDKIKDLASRAVLAVGIENGPAHVEIMLTENGPKMIELGARLGGDCITTHLTPLSTGVDMVEACILLSCGETPDVAPKLSLASAIKFIKCENGILKSIDGDDGARAIDGVTEVTFTKKIGDKVGDIHSSSDRVGFIIAQADTAENALEICTAAEKMLTICVE